LKAPIPSESTIKTLKGSPVFLSIKLTGRFQTQSPFVHGLIVGPTPNPYFSPNLFSKIRFSKKLFPVLYFPATATIPRFVSAISLDCNN